MPKYHYEEAPCDFYEAAKSLAEEWGVDPDSETYVALGFFVVNGINGIEAESLGIMCHLDLTPYSSSGCEGGPEVSLYDSIQQYIKDMAADPKEESQLRSGISSALFDLANMVASNGE